MLRRSLRVLGALLVMATPAQAQMDAAGGQGAPRTLRAAHVGAEAPAIDGVLDEAVWQRAEFATGFIQLRPNEGRPASERTEAYLLYDDVALYVAARLYDGAPDSVAGRLFRRDGNDYSDWFYVHIDSYFDRRTGFSFAVNPRG
ncbi:MAG: hypothetical protein R3247_10730, partial [Rhodothermales bacterium]|nr:hypothetical protein [Rhodothermales bacterium]